MLIAQLVKQLVPSYRRPICAPAGFPRRSWDHHDLFEVGAKLVATQTVGCNRSAKELTQGCQNPFAYTTCFARIQSWSWVVDRGIYTSILLNNIVGYICRRSSSHYSSYWERSVYVLSAKDVWMAHSRGVEHKIAVPVSRVGAPLGHSLSHSMDSVALFVFRQADSKPSMGK